VNASATKKLRGIPVVYAGIVVALAIGASNPAFGAGYRLREASATAMGAAYAGASATGSDASFLAYNPASLGLVDTYDSSISLVGLFPSSSGEYTTATTSALTPVSGSLRPSGYVDTAFVPEMAARVRFSPEWSGGILVYAPWGLSTNYDATWAGRYYALKSRLTTINITPTLAYQPSKQLSIGAGPQFQYAKGTLSNAVDIGTIGALFSIPGSIPGGMDGSAIVKGDGWGYGFVVGAIAELSNDVSLGVSYHSAVHQTLTGNLDFTLDTAGVGTVLNGAGLLLDTTAEAKITTPEIASFGARVRLSPGWTALAEADWTGWTAFKEVRIHPIGIPQPDDVTDERWKSTWFVALGAEFTPDERWTWRGGVAWDQSPVPSTTFGPRIPDADRTWVSLGLTYKATDAIGLSLSYAHLFLPDGTVSRNQTQTGNALRGNLQGRTEGSANYLGIQLNYRTP
jgi:long-chain fatty acid transport protein